MEAKAQIRELREMIKSFVTTNRPQCQHEPIEGWESTVGKAPCKKCGFVVY